jgi:hypothetical protein
MSNVENEQIAIEKPGRVKRVLTYIMLCVFTTSSFAGPASQLAQHGGLFGAIPMSASAAMGAEPNAEEARLLKFFETARERVGAVAGKADKFGKLPSAAAQREAKAELEDLLDEMDDVEESVKEGFDAVGDFIKEKKLPKTIRARHEAAMAQVSGEFEAVRRDIRQISKEKDAKKVKSLAEGLHRRLDRDRFERSQQEFDPNELPNSSLKSDLNYAPRLTENDFIRDGLVGNPIRRVAQAGGYNVAGLPGAGDPAYLSESDEVVLTDDVRAKAAELEYRPVRIYEWVRNNVHWQPTWGAIQDASHTLSSQRGNAFDIATLTIALLRASNIPARYVHGTIDVPEARFRNWAGGFQNLNAAMEFASAGGIPLGPVATAGKIAKVRMEHVWVEAAIDFQPSRGARNLAADSWVAIDTSYKEVVAQSGLNVAQITGVDATAVAAEVLAEASQDPTLGWVTSPDFGVLTAAGEQAKVQFEEFLENSPEDESLGDIVGQRLIQTLAATTLPTSLPNRVVVLGARYSSLPPQLRQQMTFSIGKDLTGEPIAGRTFAWAKVNNRQIILSFRPATADDTAIAMSYMPGTASGPTASSIPAYLIHLVPELMIDGVVVMSGAPVAMGAEVEFVFNPTFAGRGVRPFSYKLRAGSYLAVSTAAGSISLAAFRQARERLASTREIFGSNDQSRLLGIDRDRLLGDALHATLLAYYSQYAFYGEVSGRQANGFHQLAAGVGTFGFEPSGTYLFGLPRTVNGGGFVMNVPIVNIVGVDTPSISSAADFTFQLGAISSLLEHAVPESMFSTESNPVRGVSAVGALAKAGSSGQRLFTITASNQQAALPLLHHDERTIIEIRGALAAGRSVVIHESPVSVPGWTGAGYVILDEATGSAAWKISGGQNGAHFWIGFFLGVSFSAITFALTLILKQMSMAAFLLAGPLHFYLLFIAILAFSYITYRVIADADAEERGCLNAGFAIGAALFTIVTTFRKSVVGAIAAVITAFTGNVIFGTTVEDAAECVEPST